MSCLHYSTSPQFSHFTSPIYYIFRSSYSCLIDIFCSDKKYLSFGRSWYNLKASYVSNMRFSAAILSVTLAFLVYRTESFQSPIETAEYLLPGPDIANVFSYGCGGGVSSNGLYAIAGGFFK